MQAEYLREAKTITAERRSPVVQGIKGEPQREGHFQWLTGAPTAGKQAQLAYNKNAGAIRHSQVCAALPSWQQSTVVCSYMLRQRQGSCTPVRNCCFLMQLLLLKKQYC